MGGKNRSDTPAEPTPTGRLFLWVSHTWPRRWWLNTLLGITVFFSVIEYYFGSIIDYYTAGSRALSPFLIVVLSLWGLTLIGRILVFVVDGE